MPGTMTACTSMRSRAGFGCRCGKADCRTHVADAMMTWPVLMSMAMTDQVAWAGAGAARAFRMSRGLGCSKVLTRAAQRKESVITTRAKRARDLLSLAQQQQI